jgi:predicted Zn-dependent protease
LNILNGEGFVRELVEATFNSERNQVKYSEFYKQFIHSSEFRQIAFYGKLVIIDEDLYDDGLNWCFGGFGPTFIRQRGKFGLGQVILSSARIIDVTHARDWLRHEIGHMFNAPSKRRKNTVESLGLHCTCNLCVMQQKLRVDESYKYSIERAKKKAYTYCPYCEKDIRDYVVPS